jgi:putative two-component system response regulator
MKPLVLIVDDTPANISLLANLLKGTYDIRIATNGAKAIELAQQEPVPDAILLDVMMPQTDGWTVCQHLKTLPATKHIPILFLTAKNSIEDEEYGINLGAVDFISKPFSPPVVLARLRTHLQNREYRLQDASILVMVSLAEFRDECTGWHIRRTQEFVRELALELATQPRYQNILTGEYIEQLYKSAPLHDIGKIAIPDHILLKPGKLTHEEMRVMKTHTEKGAEILRQAQQYSSDTDGFFLIAMDIARSHHERWDGEGYPDRIRGEAIPLAARIMAVADVYDALTSGRPYKPPLPHEVASDHLLQGSGSQFDPGVIGAFEHRKSRFLEIASTWRDPAVSG